MTDLLLSHFRMLAVYNKLANHRLYKACDRLSDFERKKRRESFFGSIHGTLNHIMVGDLIWMARFYGKEVPSTNLDAILYENFEELWAARRQEDDIIEAFTADINEEFLDGTVRYVNNENRNIEDPIDLLLAHFFNHQTHHRGQIHDMLTQTEINPPVLDLHRVTCP